MMDPAGDSTNRTTQTVVPRREFLAAAGATSTLALAGCLGGGSGDAVTVAALNPITGPFSSLGPGQRSGAELAVEEVNNNDDFDFEFELVTGDTETESGAAQDEAQRVVQDEGAEYVFGAISSSVALALNEFAGESDFIYFPGGAAVPITGSSCNENVFRFETNTAQIAEAISAYTVNNISTDVWFHTADYAYGDSVYNRVSSRMESANSDYAEIGRSRSQLGADSYGSFISNISNSDAGVVVLGMTGGDLVTFTNQAANAGLTDEIAVVGPTQSFRSVRAGTGENSAGTFGGVRYLPSLETGDNQQFVDAYTDSNDGQPGNFARVGYDSIRLMAKGMNQAGSTNVDDVRDALAGGTFETVLGEITLREGDHQATNPTWIGELVTGEDSGLATDVELIEQVPGDETLPPASDLGCEL
jgi:ABC-type branched-chain amino acid transport systems, periplasmic component